MVKFIKQKCWHDVSSVSDYAWAKEQLDSGSSVLGYEYEGVVRLSVHGGGEYQVAGRVGDDQSGHITNLC